MRIIKWLLFLITLLPVMVNAHEHPALFHAFQLEVDAGENRNNESVISWDFDGWLGDDNNKLWLKSEGKTVGNNTENSEVWTLYSRNIDTFWDGQTGVRYDSNPASTAYWVIGVTGTAPQFIETEAHLFVSDKGDMSARLHVERDFLFTQQWILQPYAEAHAFAQAVHEIDKGSGLSDVTLGLQLRYEVTRKFAPYIEISSERLLGETANIAEKNNRDRSDTRIVAGVRLLF